MQLELYALAHIVTIGLAKPNMSISIIIHIKISNAQFRTLRSIGRHHETYRYLSSVTRPPIGADHASVYLPQFLGELGLTIQALQAEFLAPLQAYVVFVPNSMALP